MTYLGVIALFLILRFLTHFKGNAEISLLDNLLSELLYSDHVYNTVVTLSKQ